jgi:hypothetical protein
MASAEKRTKPRVLGQESDAKSLWCGLKASEAAFAPAHNSQAEPNA